LFLYPYWPGCNTDTFIFGHVYHFGQRTYLMAANQGKTLSVSQQNYTLF